MFENISKGIESFHTSNSISFPTGPKEHGGKLVIGGIMPNVGFFTGTMSSK